MDEMARLSAEISASPLLLILVAGGIGILGSVIGGGIAAWATKAAVRRSVDAQFALQSAESERRDRERRRAQRPRNEGKAGTGATGYGGGSGAHHRSSLELDAALDCRERGERIGFQCESAY